MKTDFKFSNLLGTVYCKGNLLFTPDGTCLVSPVGNRVSVFDLVNNKSYTLPFSHRKNIARIDLNPQGNILLTIDEDGRAILTNFPRRISIYHFSFKSAVSTLAFSPSGRHFVVGVGRIVEIWHTPSTPDTVADGELEFAPFVLHRRLAGHFDTVQSIHWSSDSRFFLTSSKDLTARVWSLDPEEGFEPTTLAGHKESVKNAWFSKDQETIYTVSQDGALFQWQYVRKLSDGEMTEDGDLRWRITKKHFFMQNNVKLNCASYHADTNLLVVGFSNGLFGLYEMPDFNEIHKLSVSQSDIDFVTINKSGEWLAFGASKLGQLLVWEWQSESYILKQQGHMDSMNSLVYSPDGQKIITTADDGKIKVWDVNSGFCVVTFTEHTSGVTACEFSKRGNNVLFTSSLDGSVRAWDLIRYRNFRTFTAPSRLSFTSLAADPSGEVVCAGSLDSFDIHIWSVQTGQLLDQLSGHEGPVSSLAFSPSGGPLISGSWDHTVRIWSVFDRTQTSEPLQLQADLLCVAVRPDSRQLAASTLDGQLTFWSISDAAQESGIDARRDVSGGRKISDRRIAASSPSTKAFSTITYSADGSCLLAGGSSKYICLYSVNTGTLIKKFTISVNLSFDGTQEFLNSRHITASGIPSQLIDDASTSDEDARNSRALPGASRGLDPSLRTTRPTIRSSSLAFSPHARSFCAATTEGLLIYSLDTQALTSFDPFDLDIEITLSTILATLSEKSYLHALIMSFRLNEAPLIRTVYETIPPPDISLAVADLPTVYLSRLLRFVATMAVESPHLEFNLRWLEAILRTHGRFIKDNKGQFEAEVRMVQRAVASVRGELGRLGDENVYTLDYLLSQSGRRKGNGIGNGVGKVDGHAVAGEKELKADGMDVDRDEGGDEDEEEWIGLD